MKRMLALICAGLMGIAGTAAKAETAADTLPQPAARDYIIFGSYEQDNDLHNGQESIEWLVLTVDEEENKAYLLSRYALENKLYHNTLEPITWADCDLRAWLNTDFYTKAFTEEEQTAILLTHVSNANEEGWHSYKTYGGVDTYDYIFLPSHDEIYVLYLPNHADQKTTSTAYVKANGAKTHCAWWLRSPGAEQNRACYVEVGKDLSEHTLNSAQVNYRNWHFTVRPAMWLDLTQVDLKCVSQDEKTGALTFTATPVDWK